MKNRLPQLVADVILRLAKAPAGLRPLRTTVPHDDSIDGIASAEAINNAVAPIQREMIKSFGFEDLIPKVHA